MSNSPWSRFDRRRQLLAAWERRCRAKGGGEHCAGADALFLVTTLANAIRHGAATPELGRAARTWGAGFPAPVEALATLMHLRDALLDMGGGDLGGPSTPSTVNRVFDQVMMEAVDAAAANLRTVALKDPLTGCANRRALDEELGNAVTSARRSGLDLSVAIVDLDGLKAINDGQGHAAGDAALVALVATLRTVLREADNLYRTGGDEFVVVAPFTEPAGARALMRRAERPSGPSFSWGVASLGQLPQDVASDMVAPALLAAADADLYESRRARRDAQRREQRRRRAGSVASVAASAAIVASGAGLAAALSVGSPSGRSPATGTTVTGPEASESPGGSASPQFHPEEPSKLDAAGPTAGSSGSAGEAGPAPPSGLPTPVTSLVSTVTHPVAAAVELSASTLSAVAGQEVRYVADVLPVGSGGVVGFLDAGGTIPGCERVPVSAGLAACTVSYASAGSHAISAVFTPSSADVAGASSPTLSQSVTEPDGRQDSDGGGRASTAGAQDRSGGDSTPTDRWHDDGSAGRSSDCGGGGDHGRDEKGGRS